MAAREPFSDRTTAGHALGKRLLERDVDVDLVLAIPRGGLPTGRAVADALDVPLDVIVTSKVTDPSNPELALGAVGADGTVVVNEALRDALGVSTAQFDRRAERKIAAAREKEAAYRRNRPPLDVSGRAVLVVDDGIATGSTVLAAIDVLRAGGARSVLVAVPVGPPEAIDELRDVADAVIVLREPAYFGAVGRFYRDFSQVDDATAITYLE